ncbi:MAG: rhomboid family intramembrane serine protease, partial [Phascolarctobacterium sp.]|nr:rhomboid family intramembrane serine protease [Phascolarctobacterium sp.]
MAKNPRFGIPNLMKYIIIGTALVGVLNMFTNYAASSYLAFNLAAVLRGEVFRLISFIFVPESSSPFFLFISLYFYYIIGNALESYWGHGRFTIYFCSGVLLTLLFTIVYSLISGVSYTLSGISYVTSSLFFAFAMLYGEARVLLFFFLPIKVKWFAFYEAVMFALEIVTCLSTGNYYYAFLPVVALL